MMKGMIAGYCLLLAMALLMPAQANTGTELEPAEQFLITTANRLLDRILAERAVLSEHPERMYELLDESIIVHVDFTNMSKLILGKRAWRSGSEEQREQFIESLSTLLVRTYAKALLEYSGGTVEHVRTRKKTDSSLTLVETQVKQAEGKVLPINYLMHARSGQWRVIDLVVDGVSLVKVYKGSFATDIKEGGIAVVLDKLSQRNSAASR